MANGGHSSWPFLRFRKARWRTRSHIKTLARQLQGCNRPKDQWSTQSYGMSQALVCFNNWQWCATQLRWLKGTRGVWAHRWGSMALHTAVQRRRADPADGFSAPLHRSLTCQEWEGEIERWLTRKRSRDHEPIVIRCRGSCPIRALATGLKAVRSVPCRLLRRAG